MVDFLNDDVRFEGDVTFEGEAVANGGLTVGPGGLQYGAAVGPWVAPVRVCVQDTTQRTLLVNWRNTNAPITPANPLLVWRADGSLTGVQEMTVDGVNWVAESPLPGDVEMCLSSTVPYGWAPMEGQILANAATSYPALWSVADVALRVGSGLRIPDMRGRTPIGVGQGAGLTLRNMGDNSGDESITLSPLQLPAHNHTGTTAGPDRSLNHQHSFRLSHVSGSNPAGSALEFEAHPVSTAGTSHETGSISSTTAPNAGGLVHAHPFTTANTGGGQAHPNMQPFTVVRFRVKL